jgi:hypothetical protein
MNEKTIITYLHSVFPILCIFCSSFIARLDKSPVLLTYGLTCAILINFLALAINGISFQLVDGKMIRSVGTFNNPNQLANFSVICWAFFLSMYYDGILKFKLFFTLLLSLFILNLLGLSKAGLLAFILGYILHLFGTNSKYKTVLSSMIICCIFLFIFSLYEIDYSSISALARLDDIGMDDDDSFAKRGYFLNTENSNLKEIFFGIGEAEIFHRLGSEVHSSLASVFVRSGLIAFIIYLMVLLFIFKNYINHFGYIKALAIITPIIVYGVAHAGFRTPLFWMVVLFIYFNIEYKNSKKKREFTAGRLL